MCDKQTGVDCIHALKMRMVDDLLAISDEGVADGSEQVQ